MPLLPAQLPTGPELERLLEAAEVALYEDFYDALPASVSLELGIEAERLGPALRLSARGFDHRLFNRILGMDDPGSLVEPAARYYGELGVRWWMLQVPPHVQTEAFRALAQARGLARLRGWAKHVGPASLRVPSRTDLRVARVAGEARGTLADTPSGEVRIRAVKAWAEIVVRTFGLHAGLEPWFRALAGRPGWHLYLAYHDHRPVSAAALYHPPGDAGALAQLCFAGTLPAHRGRGAQSALIARRFEDAQTLGARWVATETGESMPGRPNPGFRNMVRLGLPARYVRTNWGPSRAAPRHYP
jgi:GNAT superfamily N-acetyltransferase